MGVIPWQEVQAVASQNAVSATQPNQKFRDIVELYMKNRLPTDLHPSFQAIYDGKTTNPRPSLPASSHTEPLLVTATALSQISENDDLDHEQEETFSVKELYEESEKEKERFSLSMKAYERGADPKYKTNITAETFHTWDEVLEEVDRAVSRHKDGKNSWSAIRQGLRKFGSNHSAFNAWTGLFPTQSEYCSIICGGLKLILGAAARLHDIRESVCKALAEIPVLLNNTKLILGAFKKSKELHLCSSALYVRTLGALEHIICWYQEKAARKKLMAFLKQDTYEKALTKKVDDIKLASDRFAEAAKICSYQKQRVLHREVRQNRTEVKQNRVIIERTRSESAQHYDSLDHAVRTEAKQIKTDMEVRLAKLESNNESKNNELKNTMKETMKSTIDDLLQNFFSSNERIDRKTHDLRGPSLPIRNLARFSRLKKQRSQMQQEALEALNYEHSIPAIDIQTLLRIAWTLPKPAQDRAVSLMQEPKLHTWIRSHASFILFVNGNFNTSAKQSPLSFVSAKLIDSIAPASSSNTSPGPNGIIALAFFCGQHLNPKDPDAGLGGMMRNLVAQLLVAYSAFDLSIIRRLATLDPMDVEALSEAFSLLIADIPAQTMVFCMIDGITFHEDSRSRCKEAQAVLRGFLDLMQCHLGEGNCVFKVLLTCPGMSRNLYKEVAKEDVIWMPKSVRAQGGFTSMKWNTSAGRDVGDVIKS